MLLSNYRRFLFVHIYKNAGTSITTALMPYALSPWERGINRARVGMRKKIVYDPKPYPDHITAPELMENMGEDAFNSYFSFAIVRNPWDWQRSMYKFMLRKPWHQHHELVKKLGSFEEYVRWRCDEDAHLQQDFIYSKDDEKLVDFIGKYENLDEDFKAICSRIGVKAILPKLNASSDKEHYREFYSDATREMIGHTFQADIEKFRYAF